MKTIILLGCGKEKSMKPCKAKNMYIGRYFKKNYEYAQYLSKKYNAKIFILSAKYGLLDLETEINPYNITLNNQNEANKKRWAIKVINQLNKIIYINDNIIFLAGENYTKYLKKYYKNHQEPLKGLRMGEKMKRINNLLKER